MTRTLGTNGPAVSAIGLGAMGMSDLYGPADRAESIATIQAALDAGVTLIDTGDFYGSGHNELLIREALAGRRRESVVISVKFGALRDPAGGWIGVDTIPVHIKNDLAQSLQRLSTDYIDIYRPARLDPKVLIEETIGAMAEMVKAGYIRHIGLLMPLLIEFFEIDGNRQFHIEERGFDEAGYGGRHVVGAALAVRHEPRPAVLDDRLDQPLDDKSIAANIPERYQNGSRPRRAWVLPIPRTAWA